MTDPYTHRLLTNMLAGALGGIFSSAIMRAPVLVVAFCGSIGAVLGTVLGLLGP
jgi:hypothetical protein